MLSFKRSNQVVVVEAVEEVVVVEGVEEVGSRQTEA